MSGELNESYFVDKNLIILFLFLIITGLIHYVQAILNSFKADLRFLPSAAVHISVAAQFSFPSFLSHSYILKTLFLQRLIIFVHVPQQFFLPIQKTLIPL